MKTFGKIFTASLIMSSLLKSGTYNIKDFGAIGDGKTLNTIAIQKAVDSCHRTGGGTVVVPVGTFISGTIQLFSNIDLHLDRGATLKGSENVSDYFLGGKKVGLVYAENTYNLSITGEGSIDGSGDAFMDLNRSKVFDSASVQFTRQGNHFREVLSGLGDGPLVPKDRPFQMIIFSNCTNVTVRDVNVLNAPFWTIHFADCDGVIVSGVRVWNNLMIPNNDGMDFTSCSNVQVSDCDIRTGDDAIAITGYAFHFDLPGYKNLRHPSENITITNCTLVSRSSAIRIGGWDQNTMNNYTFSNIVIANSNRGIDLCVRDEGSIQNMVFSNIVIQTRFYTGDWWGNGEPIHISVIRGKEKVKLGTISGIKFSHIISEGESGFLLNGTDEGRIDNISFDDVSFRFKTSQLNKTCGGNFDLRPVIEQKYSMFKHDISAFYACYVHNIKLNKFDVTWENVEEPYFTNGIEFSNFKDITISNCVIDAAPHNLKAPAINLVDGTKVRITDSRTTKEGVKFISKQNVK